MKEEIKEILDYIDDKIIPNEKWNKIKDYITNLQEENKKLKEIAHKMHLWIFLHSEDEQKVYDELGLTDEENIILGYSGQFKLKGDKDEIEKLGC